MNTWYHFAKNKNLSYSSYQNAILCPIQDHQTPNNVAERFEKITIPASTLKLPPFAHRWQQKQVHRLPMCQQKHAR